ncbi:single-stranded DNA-binding protein [Candidatus Magnetobacterium casense]|uniref:Single-stranded DNA-binding protein n=1 Tax=Candidatus Magnetobacterium casense TaxID=1455061 RepID=A0ABS6S1E5_9BACT|nr:single-stranded DNA-binding protein [Candidatus Magnetobacterium casensis]MBV6342415.1 single-stranded DNA-binding protein [Candidatus Magnetobacterium casensis]
MSDLNKWTGVGRCTADPELRHLPSGTAVTTFSIANDKTWVAEGEKKQEVSFFRCVAWGKLAETITTYVKKGHRVGISGRLRQNRWEDSDGKKRDAIEITVEELQFLQAKGEGREEPPIQEPQGSSNAGPTGSNAEKPFADDDIPF